MLHKRITVVLVAAAFLSFNGVAAAQDADPSGSAEHGAQLFQQLTCYSCHGTQGQGGDRGAGPRIAPEPQPFAVVKLQLRNPRQDMPAYTAKWVSDQDIADIYAYLKSVPAARAANDIPLLKPSP